MAKPRSPVHRGLGEENNVALLGGGHMQVLRERALVLYNGYYIMVNDSSVSTQWSSGGEGKGSSQCAGALG